MTEAVPVDETAGGIHGEVPQYPSQSRPTAVPSGKWTMKERSKEVSWLAWKTKATWLLLSKVTTATLPGNNKSESVKVNLPQRIWCVSHIQPLDQCCYIILTQNILVLQIANVWEEMGYPKQPALLIKDKSRGLIVFLFRKSLREYNFGWSRTCKYHRQAQSLNLGVNKAAKDLSQHLYSQEVGRTPTKYSSDEGTWCPLACCSVRHPK